MLGPAMLKIIRFASLAGVLPALALCGCGGDSEAGVCNVSVSSLCADSLVAELSLPSGARINNVAYSVTGNGIEEIAGWINTAAPRATASAWVAGIPAGNDYVITLTAMTIGGDRSCQGSARFDMLGSASTSDTSPDCVGSQFMGGDRVGENTCASLTRAVVAPLQTAKGQLIDVKVSGSDADGDNVRFQWEATTGFFYYDYESDTRFECFDSDEELITIEVSDDNFKNCIDRRSVRVRCADLDPESRE